MDYQYQYQGDYSGMPIDDGTAAAFVAGFFGVIMLISLAFYVYVAFCLMKIAQKTNTPNAWFAWVPILNVILMIQIAKKPMWWFLMLLIPFVNIVFTILLWMEIAKAVGKPEWWGILMIVPFVNLVVPGYLAFSSEGGLQNQQPQQETAPSEPQVIETDPQQPADQKPEVIKEDATASDDGKTNDEE